MGWENQTFLSLGQSRTANGLAFDLTCAGARSRLRPFVSCSALRAEYLSLTFPHSGGIDGVGKPNLSLLGPV